MYQPLLTRFSLIQSYLIASPQVTEFVNLSEKNMVHLRLKTINKFAKMKNLKEIPEKEVRNWIQQMGAGKWPTLGFA